MSHWDIKVSSKELDYLIGFANDFDGSTVEAGVFSDSSYDDGVSVISAAIKNEFGGVNSDGTYTPPRSYMRTTEDEKINDWNSVLISGALNVLEGKSTYSDSVTSLGEVVASDIIDKVLAIQEPELAHRTIEGRINRGNSSSKPLIDTGKFLESITYEVDSK